MKSMEHIINKFEAYLVTEKCCTINTYQAYIQDLRQFSTFVSSHNKTLSMVDLPTIKLFLMHLKKNALKARTIARKISSLKVFFTWAHHALQWKNYTEDLILPKIEKKLPNFLSPDEIQELLQAAHSDNSDVGKRNCVMLYLLYASGIRITELTTLLTSSIDLDAGHVTIQGKGGKGRMVPLPQAVVAMLQDYLNTSYKKFVEKHTATEYLFPIFYAGAMKPISRQAFWAVLKDLCKKTTLQRNVSPHVLRHSLATHLLKNGANLRSLQLLLGHENLSTVEIYTHVELSYLRTIYDKKHPRSQ
jgi:integrase/recombinase XerD